MSHLLSAAVVIGLTASVLGQGAQTPDALARALQQRYNGINDFKAEFVQVARGRFLRTESRGEGTVSVKKPGRMKWRYTKPEKQIYVSDGVKIYNYIPAQRRVYKSDAPSGSEAPTFLLFLAGKGDISRDFTAAHATSPTPGTVALRLTPRKPEPDYEYLVIVVDQKSLQLRQLTQRDQQGGESAITFSNLKENTGISDSAFAFTPPSGAEIIIADDGVARR